MSENTQLQCPACRVKVQLKINQMSRNFLAENLAKEWKDDQRYKIKIYFTNILSGII